MRGLWNLGNTCYFNTAVQALAHVPPLTKHLFSVDLEQCPCEITKEYQKVVRQLFVKDRSDPVSPSDLLGAFRVRFPQFANGQHDSQEVVLLLIDVFETALGREFVTEIFNGEDAQETLWDGGMSIVRNPFTALILDVTEPCRLKDLMDDRAEPIPIENYVDSDGKAHETAAVRRVVVRWPKVICFSFSMYDHKFPIEIPLEFENKKLFACIVHLGVQNGGHYALLVRRYDKWYIKDDDQVREVPKIENLRGEFYMAFYRP
jgi:ubiquitin C-terminal hydrolase